MIREIVAYNLKRIRREQQRNQKDVAQGCNFEIPSYSRWENGKSWPSPETIQALAKYYKVSPTEFYKPINGQYLPSLTDALIVIERELGIKIDLKKPHPKKK